MWLVIGILGISVIGGIAWAGGEFSWERVEERVSQLLVEKISEPFEGFLGASGTRFPNGISADTTSPIAGEVRGTTLTVSGESQLSTVVAGGSVYTTSTLNSTTFTAAQICDNSVILMTPNIPVLNLTLPATSTLYDDCLNTDGDTKEVLIRNVTTTAVTSMLLVAGTGIVSMSSPTTTAVSGDMIRTDNNARLKFTRLGNDVGQISVETILFRDAD